MLDIDGKRGEKRREGRAAVLALFCLRCLTLTECVFSRFLSLCVSVCVCLFVSLITADLPT